MILWNFGNLAVKWGTVNGGLGVGVGNVHYSLSKHLFKNNRIINLLIRRGEALYYTITGNFQT